MTYYRVGYNSTRSALRLSREEGRRPLSRSLDKMNYSQFLLLRGILNIFGISIFFDRFLMFEIQDFAKFSLDKQPPLCLHINYGRIRVFI